MLRQFFSNYPSKKRISLHSVMDRLTSSSLGNMFIEFKHVMESFPNPILITNAKAKIIYVNPAWEKLTGYTLAEVEGKTPNFLKSVKTPRKLYKNLWKTILSGKTFNSEEMVNRRKSGKEYQMNTTIFPIIRNGVSTFYVQVEENITNRKKLDELKRHFLHAATHELKTPIASLKLLIQLQVKKINKSYDSSDVLHALHLVDRELDRLTRLINELSDVTRIESGKFNMDMKEIDISVLIHEVVQQMRLMTHDHDISIQECNSVHVIGDTDRLKQVFINLITNAIKYTPKQGKITISSKVFDTDVVISIKDTGVGISKKELPHIFNKYYQIERASQTGFGLGLYIAKEIIKFHKGKIWVDSQPRKGSAFFFTLRRSL